MPAHLELMSANLTSHVVPRRTVSNRIAVAALHAAGSAGMSPETFAARTGIAAQDLIDINGRIDGARHRRLVELMASMSPNVERLLDERCGLFPDFPVLGNLCLNARTLREAIDAFITFRPLIGEFDFLFCKETPEWVRFEYIAEFAPDNCFQALANFHVLATLIRAYDGAHATAFRVALTCSEPRRSRTPGDFFGTTVQYCAPANQMQFSAAALDQPFSKYNAVLAPFLLEQTHKELQRVQQSGLFSARVADLVRDILADESAEAPTSSSLLAQICERLNTSRWTLRRQLQAEGLHFSELEARVKFKEACRLLADTRFSVAQISEQLGFSSQSAFTRFFRSRHATPPVAFRQWAQMQQESRGWI
jgi:AraC-like DNA-binding protein